MAKEKSAYEMSYEEFFQLYKTLYNQTNITPIFKQKVLVNWERVKRNEPFDRMRPIDTKKLYPKIMGYERVKKERRDFFGKIRSIRERLKYTNNDMFMISYYTKTNNKEELKKHIGLSKEERLIIQHNSELFPDILSGSESLEPRLKYVHSILSNDKPNLLSVMTSLDKFMYQVRNKHQFKGRMKKKLDMFKYSNLDDIREEYSENPETFMVVLTNNNTKVRTILETYNKDEAINVYEENVTKYAKVDIPQIYTSAKTKSKYELLLVKKVIGDVEDVSYIRDSVTGKFVTLEVEGNNNVQILNKSSIFVENDYFVFGYHPQKQRKEYKWIRRNIIDPTLTKKKTMSIRSYSNKVMFFNEDMSDFQLVVCRNGTEAEDLVNKLSKDYLGNKYIHTLCKSTHTQENKKYMLMIREKTGWDYRVITHPYFYDK